MEPNVTGLTSCMEAGMEGCDEGLKNQTQLILDGYIQLFAHYTQMCAGRYKSEMNVLALKYQNMVKHIYDRYWY